MAMPLTTADIGIQLLMDSTVNLVSHAILCLRVLEVLSLQQVGRELRISVMTVSRREKASLAALWEQLR